MTIITTFLTLFLCYYMYKSNVTWVYSFFTLNRRLLNIHFNVELVSESMCKEAYDTQNLFYFYTKQIKTIIN